MPTVFSVQTRRPPLARNLLEWRLPGPRLGISTARTALTSATLAGNNHA